MLNMPTRILVAVVLLAFVSCGEKSGSKIPLSFSGASALTDPSAVDAVFVVNGLNLDLDGNGSPDIFVFPSSCGAALPAQCGFPLTSAARFNIGNLPLNFNYEIEARFRNAAGANLYVGKSQFTNDSKLSSIPISLTQSP